MKLFNRRRLSVMLMTSIILLQGVSPLLAIATTVESSTVESSTTESTTASNSVETPEAVTEEVPAAEEQVAEPEYVDVEADYDENELSAEYLEGSAQPAVNLTEKNLTDEVTFKGEILAGIEQQETRRTETHLTKLVLQCSESDDSWEDVHTFEIEDDSTAIQVEKYDFDFSKSLDEVKAGNYRLIAEYDIQEYEEDSLKQVNHHKGMFMVGKVEEEGDDVKSLMPELSRTQPSNQLEMQPSVNRGGLTRARDNIYINSNVGDEYVVISEIKNRSAHISFSINKNWSNASSIKVYAVYHTSPTFMKDNGIANFPYRGINTTAFDNLNSSCKVQMLKSTGLGATQTTGNVTLTGLLPKKDYYVWLVCDVGSRTGIGEEVFLFDPSGKYWASNSEVGPGNTSIGGDYRYKNPYHLYTDDPKPLSIGKPTFDSPTTNSIRLLRGTYGGDIYQSVTNNDKVEIYLGTSSTLKATKNQLWHDTKEGNNSNTYYSTSSNTGGTTVTGLSPGTKYTGKVKLRNYDNQEVVSGVSNVFSTKNSPRVPEEPTRNSPTQANPEATAEFTAYYGATSGDTNGDHPPANLSNIEIYLHDGSSYQKLSTSGSNARLAAVPTVNKNASTPNISFKVRGLSPNKNYKIKYRVKNSTGWSAESPEKGFKTKGITLLIPNEPTFTHHPDNPDTKIILNSGTYIGDISSTPNDGTVFIQSYNEAGNTEWRPTNGLTHTTGRDGTYGSITVTGLDPGTRYRGWVRLKDSDGGEVTKGGGQYFYTANTVNKPDANPTLNVPENENEATATLSATYKAAERPGQIASHPNAVEVQYSFDDSNWTKINSSSQPAVSIQQIDRDTRKITFTLSKLRAKTKYYVRYKVKNDSTGWSKASDSRDFTTKGIKLVPSDPIFEPHPNDPDTKIVMKSGTYEGDISLSPSDGLVCTESYNVAGNKDWMETPGLTHDITRGGDYGSMTATGLDPGTQYRGWVKLKNYDGDYVLKGGGQYFYTANTVNQPDANPTLNVPENENKATATLTATYKAAERPGQIASHPNAVEVQYSFDNSNWTTISSSSQPAVSIQQIDEANREITFTLSKLRAKTTYYVRYRLKNDSNSWSKYSASRDFTTKAIQLVLSPPIFNQATATSTTIFMESGSYAGDIGTALNHGVVQTESYNSGGVKDWTARVTNLAYDSVFKKYSGALVTDLKPGTRYRGWVAFKDYGTNGTDGSYQYTERKQQNGNPYYFYTTNTVEDLTSPVLGTPASINGATATFTSTYNAAGDHAAQVPAHPTKVRVFLSRDGTNFEEVTTSSAGPRLVRDDEISPSNPGGSVTFEIEGLQENTQYFVKYSVVNAGGESEKSNPVNECRFTTLSRPPGLYINEAPGVFDFGFVDYSDNELSHPLVNNSGDAYINFENINMNTNWTLSAKLSKLEFAADNLSLPGSKIRFNRSLEKTPDGTTWASADPSKFDGTIGITGSPIDLISNSGSIPLYKTTDIPYGKGNFRGVIPLNSVELIIPANTGVKGKAYTGEITWTLDDTA